MTLTLSASYGETSGNANATSGTVGATLHKFWDRWGLYATGKAARQRSDDTDENSSDIDLYGTRKITDSLSLILLEEWKRDVFKGLDHQNVVGAGVLWHVLGLDLWTMTLHAAPAWSREVTTGGQRDGVTVGVAEAHNSFTLASNTTATAIVTYYEHFRAGADYRVDVNLAAQVAINRWLGVSVAYDWELDNRPTLGAGTTDRTFRTALTLTFPGRR